MNFKRVISVILLVAFMITISACSDKKKDEAPVDPNFPVTIGDLKILEKPLAVGSMSPMMTSIIKDLGLSGRLVGISNYDAPLYDEEVDDVGDFVPANFGTAQLPDLQEIRRARPNVIITQTPFIEEDLIKLQQMSIDVVVIPAPTDTATMLEACRQIYKVFHGEITGAEEYTKFENRFNERYTYITDILMQASEGKNAVYMRELPTTLATGETYEHWFMGVLGLSNDAESYQNWTFPTEGLKDLNPEIILYDSQIDRGTIEAHANYKTVPAVKNGTLYEVNQKILDCKAPNQLLYLLEKLGRQMYPDAFPIVDTEY